MKFDTLYKKTSTGKTQRWEMEINDDNPSQYRTISGQENGKLVVSAWRTAKDKNLGKKNERLGPDQALSEIESTYKKKLKKDYYKDKADIHNGSRYYECMLAEEYDKRIAKKVSKNNPKLDYTMLYSQPKLNGMRCIAKVDGLFSREGEPINSVPHIFEDLKPIFEKEPTLVIDGELYNHDLHDDFNELMSIFKKMKPCAEDLEKSAKLGQFHVYDLDTTDNSSAHKCDLFSQRISRLISICDILKLSNSNTMIRLTETTKITTKEELDALYDRYARENYEGQMVRVNMPYENKRSGYLLKRKDFFDKEYLLIDILEGEGNWAGKAKRAILKDEETGIEFGAGILGKMPYCIKLLEEKQLYIGKQTTVNYQVLSPDKNVPIFGRVKEFGRTDNIKKN